MRGLFCFRCCFQIPHSIPLLGLIGVFALLLNFTISLTKFQVEVSMATRICAHIRTDGSQCGSPALRRRVLCRFHQSIIEREMRRRALMERLGITGAPRIELPPVEDRASAMLALNEILQCFALRIIDRVECRTLLYGVKVTLGNIKHVALLPDFMEPDPEDAPSMCE